MLNRESRRAAGVLVLSIIVPRYVDEAQFSDGWKQLVRWAVPGAVIHLPFGFFFSILPPEATDPNGPIYLCHAGGALLAVGLLLTRAGGETGAKTVSPPP